MKIAYIYNSNTYFVELDLQILNEKHEVLSLYFRKKVDALRLLKYLRVCYNSDILICWFASWHTIVPLLFSRIVGKPFVLIGGGYDSANEPKANYGNQRIWWIRFLTNFCFRHADVFVVNSDFIKKEILSIRGIDPKKIRVVYHGIPVLKENELFYSKENLALNVGNLNKSTELRKGIKPFILSASYLKDWRFIHAGRWQDDSYVKLNALRADNAKLEGFVGKERLNELFKIASVYVQPSLHEGFGLSVIEAMQYGCIPLVSKHGALPEVIGSFGLVLHDLDPETIACGIIEAERLFGNRREEIQNYINVNFNINRRSRQLLQIIEEIS